MTPDMQRVAEQQQTLHEDIERLHAWQEAHPEANGGLWLDNSAAEAGAGHVQVVLHVVGAAVDLPELTHPEHLHVVPVQHTERELRHFAEELHSRRLPGVSGVGPDVRGNRLRAYAVDEDAEALLREHHGPDLLDVRRGRVVTRAL